MLLCPKCGNKLVREERVWRCQNNHSYDIAKRGYVNLALHHKALSGDDREMVKARTRFLPMDIMHRCRLHWLSWYGAIIRQSS